MRIKLLILLPLLISFTCCGGGGGTGTSSGTASVSAPTLTSIAVSPSSPSISIGTTQQFTATANYSDGSTEDISSNVTWTSSATNVASISSSGLARSVAVGQTTIAAKYVTSMSGTTTLTVAPPPPKYAYSNASLKGQYAFTITSSGTTAPPGLACGVPLYYVGTFNADGNGNITGSMNGGVGLAGSYNVSENGQGALTLISGSPSLPMPQTYQFVLSANESSPTNPAAEGQFVQFDGLGSAIGRFVQQDSDYFSNAALNGTEVFRVLASTPCSGSPGLAEAGIFIADGNGNISSGTVDPNQFSLSGSYSIGSNGIGTLTLNTPGYTSEEFVVYVVGNGKIILLGTNGLAAIGFTEQQATGLTFSNATLAASYDFLLEGSPSDTQGTFAEGAIGRVGFDGLGNVTGGTQDEGTQAEAPVGNYISNNTIQGGTYSVAANGRTTVTETTAAGTRNYIYYLVSANRAYVVDAAGTAMGTVDMQPAPPTTATLNGDYAFAGANYLSDVALMVVSNASVVWLYADGNGNVSGFADVVVGGDGGPSTISTMVVFNGTYSVDVNGRTTVNLSTPVGVTGYVFYLISNSKSYMLGIPAPSQSGTVRLQ